MNIYDLPEEMKDSFFLGMRHALLGRITLEVRAVSVDYDGQKLTLCIYSESQLSQEDKEEFARVIPEVRAEIEYALPIEAQFFVVPMPHDFRIRGRLFFARKERDGHRESIAGSPLHNEAHPEKIDLESLGIHFDGDWGGYRELINYGERIGYFSREITHELVPTTRFIIHYNKNREAHMIPARPEGDLPEYIEDIHLRRKIEILLCLQRVLVGAIFPNLRAVQVTLATWEEQGIVLYCIFDGEITEYAREEMECVASEVAASFPDGYTTTRFFRIDYPKPIPSFGEEIVFARKEGVPSEGIRKLWDCLKRTLFSRFNH